MSKVIAAVKDIETLKSASASDAALIFYLAPNINTLAESIEIAHKGSKKIYIHMDLAEGLGKDKYAIDFAKKLGADGIISTRASIIKVAKDMGLAAVQRFFIIDAQSVESTIETAKSSKADMIEIMPGLIPKAIEKIKNKVSMPIIAGGMIETVSEASLTLKSGAWAISTSRKELWGI